MPTINDSTKSTPAEPRPLCPVCHGAVEVTPSGAVTCRRYGSEHLRHERGTYVIRDDRIDLT